MATLNFATREITARVVYFGAREAGSTTNLERLYARIHGRSKSALHRFGPRDSDERSLYFDYVSTEPAPVESFAMGYAVYSLPGGIDAKAHREEVLRGVDAVVFVADARGDRNPANVEALIELETQLRGLGMELTDLPVVLQVNHTDAEDARPVADAVFDLNPFGFPVHAAVARQDVGVLETIAEVGRAVEGRIANTLAGGSAPSPGPGLRLTAVFDPVRRTDADVVRTHIAAIQAQVMAEPPVDEVVPAQPPTPPPIADVGEPLQVEIPFQPRELVGSHPVRVLAAEIDADHVRIELSMERMGAASTRRLTVLLANRPADSLPMGRAVPSAPPDTPSDGDSVFDYLPEPDEDRIAEVEPADIPGVAYGIVGAIGGIVIGVLVSYLVAPYVARLAF